MCTVFGKAAHDILSAEVYDLNSDFLYKGNENRNNQCHLIAILESE